MSYRDVHICFTMHRIFNALECLPSRIMRPSKLALRGGYLELVAEEAAMDSAEEDFCPFSEMSCSLLRGLLMERFLRCASSDCVALGLLPSAEDASVICSSPAGSPSGCIGAT